MTRIVSLLPAATEALVKLGLEHQLVGVSHACEPPPSCSGHVPPITHWRGPALDATQGDIDAAVRRMLAAGEPLYDFDAAAFRRLRPELVLTQSLCNICAVDGGLVTIAARAVDARVWEWSPTTVDEILNGIAEIGELAGHAEAGVTLARSIRDRLFAVCQDATLAGPPVRVAFLEWLDPLFAAGHWIPELVELGGGVDVLGNPGGRSRQIDFAELAAADPDVIIAGCCGVPARQTAARLADIAATPAWQSLRAVAAGSVHAVDAERCYTSPGPSIVDAVEELASLVRDALGRAPLARRQ